MLRFKVYPTPHPPDPWAPTPRQCHWDERSREEEGNIKPVLVGLFFRGISRKYFCGLFGRKTQDFYQCKKYQMTIDQRGGNQHQAGAHCLLCSFFSLLVWLIGLFFQDVLSESKPLFSYFSSHGLFAVLLRV